MGVLVDDLGAIGPGYSRRIPAEKAAVGAYLRANGYATSCIGKWHLTPTEDTESTGSFDRWPTSPVFGFDQFYGFIGGSTNQWYPDLWEGTRPIDPPRSPEHGYHLSEDLTDKAVGFIGQQASAEIGQPWFLYLAFGATHEPHQVWPQWIERYRGRFDRGWDLVREETLSRQKQLGLVPQTTDLAPMFDDTPRWADLSDLQRRVYGRMMEVFAGFGSHTDAQIGRLVACLEATGQLRDTLILVLVGDNGAAAEGGPDGVFNRSGVPLEVVAEHLDELGGPTSRIQYPAGWGLAMNTPLRYAKSHTHLGGCRNPLVVHWPVGIGARGETRTQFHHVIDVVPTILDAAGVAMPERVSGVPQLPLEGVTMRPTFDDASAPELHDTQYFEMMGNRAIYHRGWRAVTLHTRDWRPMVQSFEDDRWELYHLADDWSETVDLAALEAERLRSLVALWEAEAERFKVLPLNDRHAFWEHNVPRRRTLYPGSTRIRADAGGSSTVDHSWAVCCSVQLDRSPVSGPIVAEGGRTGGWMLCLDSGRPAFHYNLSGLEHTTILASEILPIGQHEVALVFQLQSDEGVAPSAVACIMVDGGIAVQGPIPRTAQGCYAFDGGLDVGADHGSPVSPGFEVDNGFSGVVKRVVLELEGSVAFEELQAKIRSV